MDEMSTEQQRPRPGSSLTEAMDYRPIPLCVQDKPRLANSSDPVPMPDSARRLRSCVLCKSSKVRCKRDENRPTDACERCVSTGRECIVPARVTNKRPRRNISTVASLELKVDALVAALNVKRAGGIEDGGLERPVDMLSGRVNGLSKGYEMDTEPDLLDKDAQAIRRSPGRSTSLDNDADRAAFSSNRGTYDYATRKKALQTEHQYSFDFFMPKTCDQDKDLSRDVIDEGLISIEESVVCFVRFRETMLPHFPVVVFPPGTTATVVRTSRPVLFLAILGAASGNLGEGVRKLLVEELTRTFANRIIMRGHKSLDLVQALQVSAIWYFPPERFDELQVYQFFNLAAIMATELNFGRACRQSTSKLSLPKDGNLGRPPLGASRSNEPGLECQRAWLSCYIVCGIAFMITRHPNLMRWNSYMDECIQALESSGTAVKSDLYLCQWVRAQRIAEEIGQQLFMDDPFANVDTCDRSVQYIIRGYEQQIDQWKAQLSPDILRPTLQIEASILSLYLHEIYLHDGQNMKDFTAPFQEKSRVSAVNLKAKPLTAANRKALAICIASIKNIFDIFLSFNIETLCSIPILHYARTAYTVFTMMKIHFAAGRLDADLQEMTERDLNAEFYIDQLLKSLAEVSRARKLRVAAIFRLVLLMLRAWFQRQKSQTGTEILHIRQNDTIFHAVLQTADAINADGNINRGNVHGSNARAHEKAVASSVFHVVPMVENYEPTDVDSWPLGDQGEEMLPWNEFDYESFLDVDNSVLLQSVLERLGGLVG